MTIKEIRFPGGYVIGRIDQSQQLDQDTELRKAIDSGSGIENTFEPGQHDVTPGEFGKHVYTYHLSVRSDGNGALEMRPRFPDSMMSEKPTSSNPKDWQRGMLKTLQRGSAPIIIAGFSKGDGTFIRLFRIIYWDK